MSNTLQPTRHRHRLLTRYLGHHLQPPVPSRRDLSPHQPSKVRRSLLHQSPVTRWLAARQQRMQMRAVEVTVMTEQCDRKALRHARIQVEFLRVILGRTGGIAVN